MFGREQRLVFVVALLALVVAPAVAEEKDVDLDEFRELKSCLPLSVRVDPADGDFKLKLDGPGDTLEAVKAEVSDGVLVLSLGGKISIDEPVKLVVSAPREGLAKAGNTGGAAVVLASGFKSEKMELTNEGAGHLMAVGLEVGELTVTNSGNGGLLAGGNLESVDATADTGSVFLDGPTGAVTLSASDRFKSSSFYVLAGSDDVDISGSGVPVTKVSFDRGSCEVLTQSNLASLRRNLCKTATPTEDLTAKRDELLASLLWTCGAEAEADDGCEAPIDKGVSSGTTASSSASGTGSTTTSSSSASTDGATATATATNDGDTGSAAVAEGANGDGDDDGDDCPVDADNLKILES